MHNGPKILRLTKTASFSPKRGKIVPRTHVVFLVVLLFLAVSIHAGIHTGPQPTPGGVVVEEVTKDGAGSAAGIQPDDVLLGWSRTASPPANPEPARGVISSPFDLSEVQVE